MITRASALPQMKPDERRDSAIAFLRASVAYFAALGVSIRRVLTDNGMLKRWNHHYNWHRPHQGIGGVAPMSRLSQTRNNLLPRHTYTTQYVPTL
jgi:transposase InsO family protein